MSSSNFQTGFNTLSHPSSPAKNRVYASVAEMKRSKSKNSNKVRFSNLFSSFGELHRDFHSTPDLAHQAALASGGAGPNKNHRSQEDINLLETNRNVLPPPTHPPPPPPVVQVVKVDVSRGAQSEYENFGGKDNTQEGVVSSFRPTANAKLYASPEDMKTVGYRSRSLPSHNSKSQVRKSHSMRTNSTFKPSNGVAPPPNNKIINNNPYAQPIRASRSHSTAGTRERKKRIPNSNSSSNIGQPGAPPPIPEPDYSCSESEVESDEDHKDMSKLAARLSAVQLQPVENSGNSNTRYLNYLSFLLKVVISIYFK